MTAREDLFAAFDAEGVAARIEWYVECLTAMSSGRRVTGLAEAMAGYESALSEVRSAFTLTREEVGLAIDGVAMCVDEIHRRHAPLLHKLQKEYGRGR